MVFDLRLDCMYYVLEQMQDQQICPNSIDAQYSTQPTIQICRTTRSLRYNMIFLKVQIYVNR